MDMNFNSGKIFCTKCGTANKAGYRFCVKCGTKLMTPVPRPHPEDVQELPKTEPVKAEPEMSELRPTFSAFEQSAPVEGPVKVEPEPEMSEIQPSFGAFEQSAPVAESLQVEPEPEKEYAGFARSGFSGATTPTAAAGAFATAVEAVKNSKQIDGSDAETVMSLLEQGETSALAKGLPDWDIVPPQVVVRRKHRV